MANPSAMAQRMAEIAVAETEDEVNDRRGLHWSSLDDDILKEFKTALQARIAAKFDALVFGGENG